MLEFVWKAFLCCLSLLFFMACDKSCPSLILNENYWMSSCTTWPDKKTRHTHIDLFHLQCLVSIMARISSSNSGVSFPIRMIRVKLPNCCTFIITHPTFFKFPALTSVLHSTLWNLCIGALEVNATSYSMQQENFYRKDLRHDSAFFTGIIKLTHVWCTVDIGWNKNGVYTKLKIKDDVKLSIIHYVYVGYIYIYCHSQTDCFVVSHLLSVARHVGRLKLGSKPAQLYVRLIIIQLSQQVNHVSTGIINHFVCLPFVSYRIPECSNRSKSFAFCEWQP